jgi:hypothetical protein
VPQQPTATITNSVSVTNAEYPSVFKDHLLKPEQNHKGAIFNNSSESYWPSMVLFMILCIAVILKVTAPVRTLRILNAAYNLQVARQVEREDYSPFKRVSVLLSIIFVLTISFLLYKLNQLYGSILFNNGSLFQYLFFVMVVILTYTVKFVCMVLVSALTETDRLFTEYINNTLIINQAIGLLLFPVMVLAQLSPINPVWLVFPSVLFLVLGYLLRLYRGFVFAGLEEGVGILQLFVYLCALEILPLLVIIKFITLNFSTVR